jgi:Holliday junction DNA helicase RuvB
MKKLTFADFVGNKGVVSKVELLIDDAMKDRFARMPDMAFLGPAGHGKNTLAEIIANETKRKLLVINSTVIRDPFQFRGLIMNLAHDNHDGAMILIDECHALMRKIQDNLLTATEHPRELHTSHKDQVFTDKLPDNLSFIFATTHGGYLRPALLSRLEPIEFLPYSTSEQLEMAIKYLIRRHDFKKAEIDTKCIIEVAKRARDGRQVARFCDTIVRYMRKNKIKKLNQDVINECFVVVGVDKNGLTRLDRIMLSKLLQMNTFVGLDTLDAVMPTSKKQIKEYIEPYLLQKGFIIRTSSGRMITPKGRLALTKTGDTK